MMPELNVKFRVVREMGSQTFPLGDDHDTYEAAVEAIRGECFRVQKKYENADDLMPRLIIDTAPLQILKLFIPKL
jgi:hypothetical protein